MALYQTGVMLLRGPSGEVIEQQPIYEELPPLTLKEARAEEYTENELLKIFCEKFKVFKEIQKAKGCESGGLSDVHRIED